MDFKRFDGENTNVSKYVLEKEDAVYEAVLYKYGAFEKRTVICCSVMSGCPIGCAFCGTGKRFVRSLTGPEIVEQIAIVLQDREIDAQKVQKFQIMFMSMGEPMLNWSNTAWAIKELHHKYPNAQLLLSTMAPHGDKPDWEDMLELSRCIEKVGLQFSIHKSTDEKRNRLIPFGEKLSLGEIRDIGMRWKQETGRMPYCNYCVDGTNNTREDADRLMALFPPENFCFTFSVVCSADETMALAGYHNLDKIREFEHLFISMGYNTRVFDPAGQDDIGGGCGQLWYVQDWLRKRIS
ncbi:MAG: hypothetical protein A2018_04960 [Alphaproteobacteria bacterium GWF2_58_20]|nr:MAG: hypothetical protein A2018_04960 [Alphaproteobacteria bacterium GWF2_58_20]